MKINLKGSEEVNLVEMQEPDQMPVINVVRWDISKEIASMMEISPLTANRPKWTITLGIL